MSGFAATPGACDQEPIHTPGAIQPHGVLLAFRPGDLTLVQRAGNVEELLALDSRLIPGSSLPTTAGCAALTQQLRTQLAQSLAVKRSYFELPTPSATLAGTVHHSDGAIVVELERRVPTPHSDPTLLVQTMVGQLDGVESVAQLLGRIVDEVQRVTGYDRVMVYRFLDDGSGHVVAERCSDPTVERYLGLHYPATDIPQQARALYLRQWTRYIPDVTYSAAPLEPCDNPVTGRPLDLSLSSLRGVSPIHLEYLRNMGVAATLTLSLKVDGQLWGLIACHHLAPYYLDCMLRAGFDLFAQLCSLQLSNQLQLDRIQDEGLRRDSERKLVASVAQHGLVSGLGRQSARLRELIGAQGVAIRSGERITCYGTVPGQELILNLIAWLRQVHAGETVWFTDCLSQHFPEASQHMDSAAGLLSVTLAPGSAECLLWFLPEVRSTVLWGGNPNKDPENPSAALTPRQSFAAWREEVSGHSRPWLGGEVASASRLRAALLELNASLTLIARERDRDKQRQDLVMAELEHRVKNVLATIQALVRFSSKSADSLTTYTRSLESRLIAMSRAHNMLLASRWTGASLRRLLEEEVAPYAAADGRNIELLGHDVMLQPSAAMSLSLVLHELATNAAKHGCLTSPEGTLSVSWSVSKRSEKQDVVLEWVERGGPTVAPPTRQGFGRTLIERMYATAADSPESVIDFAPEGVRCRICIPEDGILASQPVAADLETGGSDRLEAPAGAQLEGMRVLVVEDNALVSLDIAEIIDTSGAEVVGPYRRLADAMQPAMSASFDVALLDIDIDGEAIWPLAHIVRERNIPIVFATGFSGVAQPSQEFPGAGTIVKPYDADSLVRQLAHSKAAASIQ